jgi:hypothetical protein
MIVSGFLPKRMSNFQWINARCHPPSSLVSGAVNRAMM